MNIFSNEHDGRVTPGIRFETRTTSSGTSSEINRLYYGQLGEEDRRWGGDMLAPECGGDDHP
jgi:hypothetical protein